MVLVAEDEQDIRDSLTDILVYAGYEVIGAEDGGAALELARREHPDIILLDVMMPVMDGFEVLKNLKENPSTEAIPVIILSAVPPVEGERNAIGKGAEHYLAKPCDPDVLQLTIKVALREAGIVPDERGGESKASQGSTIYPNTPDRPNSQKVIRFRENLIPLGHKLGGGIPLGSLTMVVGSSAVGKSVLCQHLAHDALFENHNTAFFSSQYTAQVLVARMDSIGLPVSEYMRDDRLCIFPIEYPISSEDPDPMLGALALDLQFLASKYELIILDSISILASACEARSVMGFFTSCKRLCVRGATIITVADPSAFDGNLSARLHDLCDAHLTLSAGRVGDRDLLVLKVDKVNNKELRTDNSIRFEVASGAGIRIIPLSQVKV